MEQRRTERIVYAIYRVLADTDEDAEQRLEWLLRMWEEVGDGPVSWPVPVQPSGIQLVGVIVGPLDKEP